MRVALKAEQSVDLRVVKKAVQKVVLMAASSAPRLAEMKAVWRVACWGHEWAVLKAGRKVEHSAG